MKQKGAYGKIRMPLSIFNSSALIPACAAAAALAACAAAAAFFLLFYRFIYHQPHKENGKGRYDNIGSHTAASFPVLK